MLKSSNSPNSQTEIQSNNNIINNNLKINLKKSLRKSSVELITTEKNEQKNQKCSIENIEEYKVNLSRFLIESNHILQKLERDLFLIRKIKSTKIII